MSTSSRRPVFLVAAPQSGAGLLARVLARSPDLAPVALPDPTDESPLAGLEEGGARPLVEDLRNALRVASLATMFPGASFVYVHRAPSATLPSMVEGWLSGRFVAHTDLPGWDGAPWAFPLIPGWQRLNGRELAEVVAEQWITITRTLLDDLEALPAGRWSVVDLRTLVAQPEREVARICEHLGVEWSDRLPAPLPTAGELLTLTPEHERDHLANLRVVMGRTRRLAERAQEWVARPQSVSPRAESPLRSVHTGAFADLLEQVTTSLLVTTYQTGKMIAIRQRDGRLNTHFRTLPRPMGVAVAPGRIAIGMRSEVLELRDMPEAAAKIEPPGSHDACFLPRRRQFTGDIRIHDVAFAGEEVWIVATAFSCLATLDGEHSFVPRWKPPFVSRLAPGDRCHLNGLCVADGAPRFVTALGETDEPGGWRDGKADGGVVIDVPTGETVLRGLSMPHSPRLHDGRLWLLESGRGTLAVADLDGGTWETVAELPGFTRGLAFAGPWAFVGLSQIRETITFGGLPITERLHERVSGVWVVDTRTGAVAAFLRFEDLVQEIFEVAVLPGIRYPEVAEETADVALRSYALP